MNDLSSLAMAVGFARRKKEQAEEALKAARADLEQTELELLQTMGNMGLASFRDTATSSVYTAQTRVYASVNEPEEAFTWLRHHGLEGIIKETVNANTLSAAIRELKDDGEIIPESIRVYEKPSLSVRRW